MADVKRCLRACGYSLSKLAFTPKSAVVLALLFFRMKDYYRNLREFLLDYGETINAFGLMRVYKMDAGTLSPQDTPVPETV